jgi:uncharacterized membrane protein HdeD (DUF308 family)
MSAATFETQRHPWWLLLMGGILNVIIGLLLLTAPAKTVLLLVLTLGIYWLVTGVFVLVGMFIDHSAWGWKFFSGLISILAGFLILRHPLISAVEIPALIILFIAIQGLVTGILMVVMAFKGGGLGAGILGILSILFGLILLLNFANLGTIVAFVWITAIFALVGGIFQIFHAFQQRSA